MHSLLLSASQSSEEGLREHKFPTGHLHFVNMKEMPVIRKHEENTFNTGQ